jgi:RNA polymerase sigma-70 factor (ECF subfamily)
MTLPELEALYRKHGRRLFGLAWQLTLNAAAAEDAVQEAFLRALRARSSYEERACAGAWLDRILVNLVREVGRRRTHFSRRIAPELMAASGTEQDPAPDPEQASAQSEALRAVRAALAEIPATFREVLVLRHFEERSTAEAAAVLDLPEATVRTRLKRARDMLIARLSPAHGRAGGEDGAV